jgi:sensor histidine kinase YesM
VQPDFVKEHSLVYYYKLEGADKDWNSTVTVLDANYSNLRGGTYTFKVCTEMTNGDKGPVTVLTVIIQPPYWQTTWFYIVGAAIFAMLVFILFRYRVNRIRKQEKNQRETERQVQEMKLTVLRTQLNPHFMFNSLNAIQHFILSNDEHHAIDYLSKFAWLMRQVLDTSRQSLIPLSEELSMLQLYLELENLRLENALHITWKTAPSVNPLETMIPPLLCQPLIENAIWHGLQQKQGGEKRLAISLWTENNNLFITIEDNGIGRKRAGEIKSSRESTHESSGVSLVKERIELLGMQQQRNTFMEFTDLHHETGEPIGTLVTVYIPVIILNPAT